MPTIFTLRVNGTAHSVSTPPNTPLLYVLRNDLRLNGAKFGCGQAQCGACSVLVDGIERRSCVYPVSIASKGRITTIEGLGTAHQPSVLQRAFIREQACQCGYCSSGMIMAAQALFERNPKPSICGKPSMRCSYFTMRSRSEEHTSELQSLAYLVCRLLLEKKQEN